MGVSNLYLLMAEIMGVIGRGVLPGRDRRLPAQPVARLAPAPPTRGWRRCCWGWARRMVGALVGGIFDHYLFNLVYPHMSVMLWTYIGLGMAAAAAGDRSHEPAPLC